MGKLSNKISHFEAQIIKRKLAVLSEMIGKGKLQTLNYALDVAIASSRSGISFNETVMHQRENETIIRQSVITQYLKMLVFENAYRNLLKWRNKK